MFLVLEVNNIAETVNKGVLIKIFIPALYERCCRQQPLHLKI